MEGPQSSAQVGMLLLNKKITCVIIGPGRNVIVEQFFFTCVIICPGRNVIVEQKNYLCTSAQVGMLLLTKFFLPVSSSAQVGMLLLNKKITCVIMCPGRNVIVEQKNYLCQCFTAG